MTVLAFILSEALMTIEASNMYLLYYNTVLNNSNHSDDSWNKVNPCNNINAVFNRSCVLSLNVSKVVRVVVTIVCEYTFFRRTTYFMSLTDTQNDT